MKDDILSACCVEFAGSVAVNQQIASYSEDAAERYIVERVEHYTQRGYPVPDHTLLVVKSPNAGSIPLLVYGKSYPGLNILWQGKDAPYMPTIRNESLQLAAFCMENGLQPAPEITKAYAHSPDFQRYSESQKINIGIKSQDVLESQPKHSQYDDWSLVFGMSDRRYTPAEQMDIIALGCMLSTSIEERHLNPSFFPSYNEIRPQVKQLLFSVSVGRIRSVSEYFEHYRAIQDAAAGVLDGKYPEISSALKNLSGLPSDKGYRDVIALLSKNGQYYIPYNPDGKMGVMEFTQTIVRGFDFPHIQQIADSKIVGYRFPSDVELPRLRTGEEEFYWNEITYLAFERGARQEYEINVGDAYYCIKQGRNPLHPSNRREKLRLELPYVKHRNNLYQPIPAPGQENKPESQKPRLKPKTPKKGRGI